MVSTRWSFSIVGIAIALCAYLGPFSAAPEASEQPTRDDLPLTQRGTPKSVKQLGIGFLWTTQSEPAINRLNSATDFVDLILGPGKLDVFQKVKPPARIACITRALKKNDDRPFPGIKETIELLRRTGVAPERVLLVYNPEGQPGTPAEEYRDLVASCRQAQQLAQAYGAPLMIGPGLRDMQQREHLYPELAKTCTMWMLQSQRLQLDEATRKPVDVEVYRAQVKRIVERLREGNPNIQVYVQLVTTAERGAVVLSAEQIAAFAQSIEDLVHGVRIYGASAELLNQIIDRLRGPHPTRSLSGGSPEGTASVPEHSEVPFPPAKTP